MKDKIVYHYCNESVLYSIIENNKFWLSDIFKMNDSSEFHWARDLFINVLQENKNNFDPKFRIYIIAKVFNADNNALPLIGCMSLDGDLLSQWRAYADDGAGFSIGFSSNLILEGLGVNFEKVEYNRRKQYKTILYFLVKAHKIWERENQNFEKIDFISTGFSIDLNYLKNSAFSEEKEARIVRLVVKDSKKNEYIDVGGNSQLQVIRPLEVKKRIRNGEDILYIELPLEIPNQQIIKEIILGPKCSIDIDKLKSKLQSLNKNNIKIHKSKISYR